MFKVISTKPLSLEEIVDYTGNDACANIGGYKCRIMNVSPGQKLDVDKVVTTDDGKTWGLKSISDNRRYQYMAFLCALSFD